MSDSVRKILEDTRELLRFRAEMGLSELPLTPEVRKFLAGGEKPAKASVADAPRPLVSRPLPATKPPRPVAAARAKSPAVGVDAQAIGEIHQELVACRLCPLQGIRTQVVVGGGCGEVRLLVIAEPPGAAEEAAGSPLAGEAGELFNKMLQAIGLERSRIYLTPLVKCRPPGDREPTEDEIHTCLNHLFREIAALNPAVICGLGPITARILTGSKQSLFQLRGRFHDFHGTPLLVTFHPAFLLRNPEMKKASWQDLQLLQRRLSSILR